MYQEVAQTMSESTSLTKYEMFTWPEKKANHVWHVGMHRQDQYVCGAAAPVIQAMMKNLGLFFVSSRHLKQQE